jgi:hypothetical protein
MKTPAQTYDWSLIKRLYTGGQTAYAISKMEGMPTKQAVMYRAKREGWDTVKAEAKELLPLVSDDESKAGRIARILERLENGATHRLAALSEGIADNTWRLWRQNDPLLASKAEEAQARYVARMAGHIDTAAQNDWKAAAWRLERHPQARDELKPRETKGDNQGLTVVIGIDRTKVSVSEDGRTLTVEPE